ncbi:MAG: cupin domain-containing protein [Acidimicrobiales bacterium]|nr:cupin domain-containing protein [Acidimicrobiales bacterium]
MPGELDADSVIELLGLEPLPHEGGMWCQTWKDDHSTAIYYLLRPGDFSALHRLLAPELYHHYAGAPVELVMVLEDGTVDRVVLGDDLAAGQRPMAVVGPGIWQGSRTLGSWSLVGTTMAPPYTDEGFELGDADALLAAHPAAAEVIRCYTRPITRPR